MSRLPKFFVVAALLFLAGVGGFSLLVDPYGAFGTPIIDGVNRYKFTSLNFARVVKPYQVQTRDYDVLLLGSSRVGRGLQCQYFIRRDLACYNAALTGGGLYEAYRLLQQSGPEISRVVVSLEFFTFVRSRIDNPDWEEERLWRDRDGERNLRFVMRAANDISGLLFASQTLKSARSTWNRQGAPFTNRRADGMLELDGHGAWFFDSTTLQGLGSNARVDRQVARFDHMLDSMKHMFVAESRNKKQLAANLVRHLRIYREFLSYCYANDIPVSLFLPPSHASYWIIPRIVGMQEQYGQWLRQLVSINAELAAAYRKPAFVIQDYSGINRLSLSAPPRRHHPETLNPYFSDAMHFEPVVGEKILANLSGDCDDLDFEGFGACLSTDNIEQHIRLGRERLQQYEQEHRRYLKTVFPNRYSYRTTGDTQDSES